MKPLLAGCAALILTLGTACTPVTNPATGEVQYTSLDPQEEIALGRQEHEKVMAQFGGAYDDPELQAFVERIGDRLVAVSELPDLDFTFTVLDSDIVNAFALPGGYVYASRGLLGLARNEAEVAGVIGHEIGHVTARHTAQRYDRAVAGQIGTAAATILGGVLAGDVGAQVGQQAVGTGAQAWVQGFSREQEFQSDQLGIRYLTRAGYDPRAMATFLEQLQANTALQQQLSGGGGNAVPNWLSSHPRTEARVQQAAQSAAEGAPEAREIDPDNFLNAIDGMVYGASPAQGLIRGQRFVHPDLRFAFDVPEGFKLQNTTSAVLGAGPDDTLLRFDGVRLEAGQTAYDALRGSASNLRSLDPVRIDGREAAIGVADLAVNNRPGQAMIAVIETESAQAYRFLYFAPGSIQRGQANDFERAIRSFEVLSAAEAAAVPIYRIDIVTVQPGDTAASLGRRMAIDNGQAWFEVLNGLANGGNLSAGDRAKIVVDG